MTDSNARTSIIVLGLIACVLAGVAVNFLPPFSVTLAFSLTAMLFALTRPRAGIFLVLILLYFPLFPNVPIGALEFSATSPLTLGLFFGTLNLQRRDTSLRLARWQVVLLMALAIAFLLSTLFSDSLGISLRMFPNLAVYCLLLYVLMVLVRSYDYLWSIARLILILGFILSIWRIELYPLRLLFGLPSLGINGAAFAFHPAVAIALVTGIMLSRETASRFWRGFVWLALFSMLYHGFLYQTRSAWLTWATMILIIGFLVRGRSRATFIIGMAGIALIGLFLFADVINRNWAQTQTTAQAALGDTSYASANPDDVIRLVAYDAGLRMFYARPVFGWGPNAYIRLKPAFVNHSGKAANEPGAFDSWLVALAELGIVGTSVTLIAFLLPLFFIWRVLQKIRNPTTMLAFAFSLGVLGLTIHLLFIDLLYSFVWVHAGLALAASRLALEQLHAYFPKSITMQKGDAISCQA